MQKLVGEPFCSSMNTNQHREKLQASLCASHLHTTNVPCSSAVKQAGELVYCDSTSSLDRYNCPTLIMSTCTSPRGIPLGVVITSGESEEVITEAITFLKAILPTNAFYGRGAQAPEVCITDDCDAERAALKNT